MGKSLTALVACLMCFACAHVDVAKEPPKVTKSVEIPSPVLPQVEKEKRIEIEGPKELFSFSLRDAEVKDVLRGIAKQTNYNVVVEPDVKGVTTVDLKNVTLRKALEYILEPLNYTYKMEAGTIYVSKPKLESRIFEVNYLSMRKTGLSTVKGSSGTERTEKSVGIELKTDTDSDTWKAIEEAVKGLLSGEGKAAVNRTASIIAVTDYTKNINAVARFLESVEVNVQRQIMIEAKIVEVSLNDSSSQGINWQFIQGRWGEFTIEATQSLLPTSPTIPFFRFFISNQHLDSFVDLLKTQGKISVVSSPKVSTLNNQRAVIKVATDDVVFETTQTVGTAGIPVLTTAIKYITIGLILDVLPQIDNQGNVIMNIHPMLTERTGVERVDEVTKNRVPVLNVRELDTLVRIKEGETVIIGGLIRERRKDDVTGVKGAMSVPLIGKLFQHKTDESERSELVIFLTPKIVYGKDAT